MESKWEESLHKKIAKKCSKCKANKIYFWLWPKKLSCLQLNKIGSWVIVWLINPLWDIEVHCRLFLCFPSHNCVMILWVASKKCTSSHALLKKQQYNLFREGLKHFQNKCIILKVFPWGITYKNMYLLGFVPGYFLIIADMPPTTP